VPEDSTNSQVARRFLSVLLAFLLLYPRSKQLLEEMRAGTGLKMLLSSVKEFIAIHRRAVGTSTNEDGVTDKLEGLVAELVRGSKLAC
jgi:hypothetical protein